MKILSALLLVSALGASISQLPEVQPDASDAPAVAPEIPIASDQDRAASLPEAEGPTDDALASLGAGEAPVQTQSSTWSGLDDATRYLLIMGTADGFSAAGPGNPCFPGRDNAALDSQLAEGGFSDQDPSSLPEALTRISAPVESCPAEPTRGYTVQLLKTMPDQHLATYLTGLVRAYSRNQACPPEAQGYAAAAVTAGIFSSPDDAQPNAVLRTALTEGCRGQPSE